MLSEEKYLLLINEFLDSNKEKLFANLKQYNQIFSQNENIVDIQINTEPNEFRICLYVMDDYGNQLDFIYDSEETIIEYILNTVCFYEPDEKKEDEFYEFLYELEDDFFDNVRQLIFNWFLETWRKLEIPYMKRVYLKIGYDSDNYDLINNIIINDNEKYK